MVCFYHLGKGAVALPKQDMVEFGNCRDFTQIHPFLALLRTRLIPGWWKIKVGIFKMMQLKYYVMTNRKFCNTFVFGCMAINVHENDFCCLSPAGAWLVIEISLNGDYVLVLL